MELHGESTEVKKNLSSLLVRLGKKKSRVIDKKLLR